VLTFKSKVYIGVIIVCIIVSAANLFFRGVSRDVGLENLPQAQTSEPPPPQPAFTERAKIRTEDMTLPAGVINGLVGIESLSKDPVMIEFHKEMSDALSNIDFTSMSAEEFEKKIIKNPQIKEILRKYSDKQDFQQSVNKMIEAVSKAAAENKSPQINKKR
jgi:hypothetical protein